MGSDNDSRKSKGTRRDAVEFYAKWPLPQCRDYRQLEPAAHQANALGHLRKWYEAKGKKGGAGIVVLPTGGGKTFTAVRFLAENPLSDGYKVLWLAHTHHLLEQAFRSFRAETIGSIREPRRDLKVRVVSGTPGHFAPRHIEPDDDVVIATLQTIATAVREGLDPVTAFLEAAGSKLFIVFDEAHHAPAPSYRKLLQGLQAAAAPTLGLTATPVYSDATKQGWLKKLFPDGILAQARATELMAAGILARPHAVPIPTSFTPSFDRRDYEKWRGEGRDLPEHIVDELAGSAERNAFIAATYAKDRARFGKTIIFTDRWYQCEAIAKALESHGVEAGSVYSHVDATPSTVAQRKKRDRDENARVLQAFREGRLDVLINVRMLTEGTDIPEAQTVFLTRQTTSRILLTQMVGRALRGPKFGGTANAYIVSFEDDWREQIQWAGFDLEDGGVDADKAERPKRPPLHLISIDLIQRLARQMHDGTNVSAVPFQAILPLGWYRTLFDARVPDSDDVEPMDLLVMVYEDEKEGFETLIAHLLAELSEELGDESITADAARNRIAALRARFLPNVGRNASDIETDILQLARHIAQRASAPKFYPFEVRASHDLDGIAREHIENDYGARRIDEELRREFAREDRFWRTLFTRYEQFRHYHEGCVARILAGRASNPPGPIVMPAPPPSEPDEAVKEEVRLRDHHACLACGTTRGLQVDHVIAVYRGGSDDASNLQTLCKRCNTTKGTESVSFRSPRTALARPPSAMKEHRVPDAGDAANPEAWERYLRRMINFHYQCGAVAEVAIAARGEGYYHWVVTLRSDNPLAWLAPHLPDLLGRIQRVREAGRKPLVESLRIRAPGQKDVVGLAEPEEAT
jgi:superfamily II DNA or RNA helicase